MEIFALFMVSLLITFLIITIYFRIKACLKIEEKNSEKAYEACIFASNCISQYWKKAIEMGYYDHHSNYFDIMKYDYVDVYENGDYSKYGAIKPLYQEIIIALIEKGEFVEI